MLNKQGPGKIDWTDFTWNPISGKCHHNCQYCYMHSIWKRFPEMATPQIKAKYLTEKMPKDPSKIFVGSSTDMWGDWVERDWILLVLGVLLVNPIHDFQFLTKNPKRYAEFPTMDNAWYGTTFDGTEKTIDNVVHLINSVHDSIRFVSFEPLLEDPIITIPYLSSLDWIIIGADSNSGAKKPPKAWADHLIETARQYDIPVFVKDNYGYPEVIKEFPEPDKSYVDFMKSLGTAIQGKPVDNEFMKANQ